MSIAVEGISKKYGEQLALDKVSFSIGTGEIVGFLGPNGAGKSTTMKILTGYLSADEGVASICGINVFDENLTDIRTKIGYLPEHNPLYLDLYVKEYLKFIAGVHQIKNADQRIKEIINLTGLSQEQAKKIGALSKGYRQRVGLAQAMIHDPEVLILDEPTTGLDPNQIVEIRQLIRQIGKTKTVLFSTHIMQEVQAICDRAIIISKGSIVADAPISQLTEKNTGFILEVEFDKPTDKKWILDIKHVNSASNTYQNKWEIRSEKDIRSELFKIAVEKGLTVLTIHQKESNLEQVFQKLTR
jgi:ABC-2 type transport system ATP-binding protein